MKTKKCGQNSLKLTSMMTQKRKHLKCASYIKKQKEFLRENYHYNLGKKRFPKTNFEKYETNRLIFCKMNIPEQIKETQGRVDHFIAEIKVWNRENKEELRYWNQEKKDARKSGIEEDLKNAEEEFKRLKKDVNVLETQRDDAISKLNELEKENKKRKVKEEEEVFVPLSEADKRLLLVSGARASCRGLVERLVKQFRKEHIHWQNKHYYNEKYNWVMPPCGYLLDSDCSVSFLLNHMPHCECYKSFKFIFKDIEVEVPSTLSKDAIQTWNGLSELIHGSELIGSNGIFVIPSNLPDDQKNFLVRISSAVHFKPRILDNDGRMRMPLSSEQVTPKKKKMKLEEKIEE
eukprot:TRINITY_DN861_c0_g1_i19.p1 TRINITY_DN861_c0_g1~~TRINITY_DN861_c0_g1_i19.p1  ORF type:complete len:347 (-),score=84.13 TRINITY_DN861_c0_g1_i19:165-1205(-)